MFVITKSVTFDAAHQIDGHIDPETGGPGKCSRLHGHTYKITVGISADGVQPIGFVIDYYWVGKLMKTIIDRWDHTFLNALPDFQDPGGVAINTTAENMAMVFYRLFRKQLPREVFDQMNRIDAKIHYVEVCETPTSSARYYPHGS